MKIFLTLRSWRKFNLQWEEIAVNEGRFKLEYDLRSHYFYTRVWGCELTMKG